jgi:teichuronic acid biosynthesis glycosyltransferase TuaG
VINPLISIVIPFYNRADYIEGSLLSIFSQSYKNWEALFVDDASSDGGENIITAYQGLDKRIRLIRLEKNSGGPAQPRNIGILEARGELIALLDSDDLWAPNKLELQVGAMSKKGAPFSYTGFYCINKYDEITTRRPSLYPDGKYKYLLNLIDYEICNSSVIFKKSIFLEHFENLRYNPDVSYGEDFLAYMLFLKKFGGISIRKPLVYYRIHNNSITELVNVRSGGFVHLYRNLTANAGLPSRPESMLLKAHSDYQLHLGEKKDPPVFSNRSTGLEKIVFLVILAFKLSRRALSWIL